MLVYPGAMDVADVPDFAALYADDAPANADRDWKASPRTACALWEAATNLTAQAFDDATRNGSAVVSPDDTEQCYWLVFHRYPPLTYTQDQVWREYAAAAFHSLAADLATGEPPPLPQCAAEEMALWLSLEDAIDRSRDDEGVQQVLATLPARPDDLDWTDCTDYLFHDHDILLLFKPEMAGVEDPEHSMHTVVPDITDYRPDAWFDPFWGATSVMTTKPTASVAPATTTTYSPARGGGSKSRSNAPIEVADSISLRRCRARCEAETGHVPAVRARRGPPRPSPPGVSRTGCPSTAAPSSYPARPGRSRKLRAVEGLRARSRRADAGFAR